jgi:hypothetical protein
MCGRVLGTLAGLLDQASECGAEGKAGDTPAPEPPSAQDSILATEESFLAVENPQVQDALEAAMPSLAATGEHAIDPSQ